MQASYGKIPRLLWTVALWSTLCVFFNKNLMTEAGTVELSAAALCATLKQAVNFDKIIENINNADVDTMPVDFQSRSLNATLTLSTIGSVTEMPGYREDVGIVVVMQGLTGGDKEPNFNAISDALLKKDEFSVLTLSVGNVLEFLTIQSPTYSAIGEKIGKALATMTRKGLNPSSIHLIGHSISAHVASSAAKQFTRATGSKVGRISGLDPGGCCFSYLDPDLRLKADDAEFVDVIHTDKGLFGYEYSVGHVDFYPNGGEDQPGCSYPHLTCSHDRSFHLYLESISEPEAFFAKSCNSYDDFKNNRCSNELRAMGYFCDKETRGKQYLQTGKQSPYGLGEKGASFKNNNENILTKFVKLFIN